MANEAVIYRRVSTTRQGDEGRSLDDQRTELRAYCRAMGWKIVGDFQDTESGRREKTEKRVGLKAAIDLACERKATLVVYDLDRLARSLSKGMAIVEKLHDAGGKLVVKSLGVDTTTNFGQLMLGIMFAFAQWASGNIGEGVKRANRNTIEQLGYRTQGTQPFGFRVVDGRLAMCPKEQEILATVREIWLENKRGYNRTAKELTKRGIPTPSMVRHGKPTVWHRQVVKQLVLSDKTQNGKIVENRVDANNIASI